MKTYDFWNRNKLWNIILFTDYINLLTELKVLEVHTIDQMEIEWI